MRTTLLATTTTNTSERNIRFAWSVAILLHLSCSQSGSVLVSSWQPSRSMQRRSTRIPPKRPVSILFPASGGGGWSKMAALQSPLFAKNVPDDDDDNSLHHDADDSSDKRSTMTALLSRFRTANGREHHEGVNGAAAGAIVDPESVERLHRENARLRERLQDLEEENQMLHYEVASRVVLETFEGEGKMRRFAEQQRELARSEYLLDDDNNNNNNHGDSDSLTWTGEEIMSEYDSMQQQDDVGMWCDELEEDGACPVEPFVSFGEALRDRAYWLVGLLVLQSCSGIILAHNEALLANHPVIIYFLTMLVGAGGNAGNQASVRVIRGLALGTLNENTQGQFLMRELKMAAALSGILSTAGFLRAAVFRTPFPETIAVTAALAMIVFSSVCLGAILPLIMKKMRLDPAHSSTSIQVVMDILGVVLAVVMASLLLDSPFGKLLISKLGG